MTVDEIQTLEQEWVRREVPHPPDCFGWAPAPIGLFQELLQVAVEHTDGGRFLDVGSGIGTKLMLAQQAGFQVEGVEQLDELVAVADEHGLTTHQADARGWDGYANYDVVYVNHPLANTEIEEPFEAWLHQQLKPGVVLIQVNDCLAPNWPALLDNREAWNGVWQRL